VLAAVIGAGTLIVVAAGFAVAGQAGLFAAAALAATAALLTVRLRIPDPPPRPERRRPRAVIPNSEFAAYRQIESALRDARVSRRLFDHAARPLLQRLLAALLAERRGADLGKDPQAGPAAVGGDLWPWLDPASPASTDSAAPGIDAHTLARIIDRLEDL
jgi:hypothetical protein